MRHEINYKEKMDDFYTSNSNSSLWSISPIGLFCHCFFVGKNLPGSNGTRFILIPFIFSWSLVNAINFLIELKIGLFQFKIFFKFIWIALVWIVPWLIFFLVSETDAPQNTHSLEYNIYAYNLAFLLWIFILLTAALWPLAATFFKKPSFKREFAVLIISIQATILATVAFHFFY